MGKRLEPGADRPSPAGGLRGLDDATMRISHEAIYQALFVQGRGALRFANWTACLRAPGACCGCRGRARAGQGKAFISPEIIDHDRSNVRRRQPRARCRATGKETFILGLGSSAIGTLVERTTRFTLLLLPAAHGGPWPRGSREQERARTRRSW